MAVRRLPPVDVTDADEAKELMGVPIDALVEHYYSIDEAIWRSEAARASQVAKVISEARKSFVAVFGALQMIVIKEGKNSLEFSNLLKQVERSSKAMGLLDTEIMTPEMEFMLFRAAIAEASTEYTARYDSPTLTPFHLVPIARSVSRHYWRYERGSVLHSDGTVDIEVEFIDIDGEVAKIAAEDQSTERQARIKIMDRALGTVRAAKGGWTAKILERLKVADPVRFKNVTTLGVLPPPPEEEETETDPPVVQPLPEDDE